MNINLGKIAALVLCDLLLAGNSFTDNKTYSAESGTVFQPGAREAVAPSAPFGHELTGNLLAYPHLEMNPLIETYMSNQKGGMANTLTLVTSSIRQLADAWQKTSLRFSILMPTLLQRQP